MLTVNGEKCDFIQSATITELLVNQGYNPAQVAVELNGAIVRRANFDGTVVSDGDEIEIVKFVGGG